MTPKISFAKSISHQEFNRAATVAVGVCHNPETQKAQGTIDAECPFATAINTGIATLTAETKTGSVTQLAVAGKTIYAVGLGENPDKASTEELRQAAGAVAREAAGKPSLLISFPHQSIAELTAIVEGTLLGSYKFDKYLPDAATAVSEIIVSTDLDADFTRVLSRAQAIADAVNQIRDLTNLPANDLDPQQLTDVALQAAVKVGLSTHVYSGEDLRKERLAGLASVGKGSAVPPRLVRLEWNPEQAHGFIALVGKGITFDTGGYSLKPAAHMVEMKTDMCGAATVLATLVCVAKLQLPVKVVGWMCIAENMVSGTAARPDDVIVYRNGKSVEINNTDAEGRLVMADGLILATEERPDVVLDIATLTGAQMVALGERITGVMGTAEIRDEVLAAAAAVDESAWGMPLPADLRRSLDSDIAHLKNSGARNGGMLVAGLFLQEFVADTPWAHIDIAGPSFNREKAYGYTPKGATGVMLRTLVQFITQRANAA